MALPTNEQSMRTLQFVSIPRGWLILLCTLTQILPSGKAAAQVVGGTISGGTNIVTNNETPSAKTRTKSTPEAIDSRQVKKLPLNGRLFDQFVLLNPKTVNYNGQYFSVDTAREFSVVTNTSSPSYGRRVSAEIGVVRGSATPQFHGDVFEYLRNNDFDARNYFDPARIPQLQRNSFGAAFGGPIHRNELFFFANYEGLRQNAGLTDVTLVPDNAARAGFLPDRNGAERPVAINPVSAQLLNLWPVQNGPEAFNDGRLTGIAESLSSPIQHTRVDSGFARLDAVPAKEDSIFATYGIDDSTAETPQQNPYSIVNEGLREQTVVLQEQHTFSPQFVETARFAFTRARLFYDGFVRPDVQAVTPTFAPGAPTGSVVISGSVAASGARGITNGGTDVGADNSLGRNSFTFDDHVVFNLGRHQLEAGIWLQRLQSNDDLSLEKYGQAAFNSLADFFSGTIRLFHYAPTPTPLNWRLLYGDAYVQDTFRMAPRVQLMAGFRSESSSGWSEAHGRAGVYNVNNGVINTEPTVQSQAVNENRALFLPEPRLGLIWDVFGNGRTSVRPAVGLFHSPLDALEYRLDQAPPFNTPYAYMGSTVANATGTKPLVLPSTVDPAIATPAMLAYSLMIEQQLAGKAFFDVSYIGSHSYHEILAGDINEPAYTLRDDGTIYYPTNKKANPQLASSLSWWSGGTANYNALAADFRQQLSHGLQLRAKYTWSKRLDDSAAWTSSVSGNTPAFVAVPSQPHLDYGPAADDIRHVFALDASYDLPFGSGRTFLSKRTGLQSQLISGWSLGSLLNAQSGFPFSPQLGYNPTGNGDPRNPIRPDVNPSFTGRLYTRGTTAQRVAEFFNPSAFSPPAYGTVGNARRDSLAGPMHADLDAALLKTTQMTGRYNFQFRAEVFNLFNHTNLQIPNEIVYANGPGQGAAAAHNTPVALGPAGVITATADTSRQMEFSVRLTF